MVPKDHSISETWVYLWDKENESAERLGLTTQVMLPQSKAICASAVFLFNMSASCIALRRKALPFWLNMLLQSDWPPINTAIAWSYNQNRIWEGYSSWQNEKHTSPPKPNPTLSNAHNELKTPFGLSFGVSMNLRTRVSDGKKYITNLHKAQRLLHTEAISVWKVEHELQIFTWFSI